MKQIQLLILFLSITQIVFAQQNGTLSGTITDKSTGQTLPGANVYIEDKTIGATTDIEGNYRLMNIPAGTYNLIIQFIGYESIKQQIIITPGAKLVVDAKMATDAIGVEEVMVTAQMLGQKKAINQQLNSGSVFVLWLIFFPFYGI